MRKYGNFTHREILDHPAESVIEIHLKPIDLMTYWKRIGVLSDFIGYFYGYSYQPEYSAEEWKKRSSEIVNSISTVFNELLENAAKYSFDKKSDIDISLVQRGKAFEIIVENKTNVTNIIEYEKSLKEIFSHPNFEELYFQKLEASHEEGQSGIGLLMILKDYPVEMEVTILESETNSKIRSHMLYLLDKSH